MARNSELETNFQNLTTENSELKAKLQKLTHQIELYQNTIDGFGHVVILINGEELVVSIFQNPYGVVQLTTAV